MRIVCRSRTVLPVALVSLASLALSSCATPSAGPSTSNVVRAEKSQTLGLENIKVIDVTDATVRQLSVTNQRSTFAEKLGEGVPNSTIIGQGDTLDVSIWEAPPATLFGMGNSGSEGSGRAIGTRAPSIPEQMVDSAGQITVPFVGKVNVVGRAPSQIAAEIEARLRGKAHLPQVVVRRMENSTANVTVVGDVAKSGRIPLTPKGERLLDVLANAGGARGSVDKVLVQLTRGASTATMPLDTIIRDPRQNIRLAPDDVITLLFQPYSFTALGAVARNSEIPFEGTGMTLAQALGRIGGLEDQRSDPTGVFIFRLENAQASSTDTTPSQLPATPVIYRVNLKNPASLFLAQKFPIYNHDVVFVSNSPTADMQKFLGILSQAAFSLTGINGVVN